MTPQETKQAKIGLGIAGVILVIYLLIKPASDPTSGLPTNDPTQYGTHIDPKKIASALYDAMKDIGTDEAEIQTLLKGVTESQFGAIITAFGTKQYNATLGNQINPGSWFSQLPFKNLQFWLKNELATETYATLRLKYPKFL